MVAQPNFDLSLPTRVQHVAATTAVRPLFRLVDGGHSTDQITRRRPQYSNGGLLFDAGLRRLEVADVVVMLTEQPGHIITKPRH